MFWYLMADGGGGASQLDRQASGAPAVMRPGLPPAAAGRPGVTGGEEAESMRDAAVLEQQVGAKEFSPSVEPDP